MFFFWKMEKKEKHLEMKQQLTHAPEFEPGSTHCACMLLEIKCTLI